MTKACKSTLRTHINAVVEATNTLRGGEISHTPREIARALEGGRKMLNKWTDSVRSAPFSAEKRRKWEMAPWRGYSRTARTGNPEVSPIRDITRLLSSSLDLSSAQSVRQPSLLLLIKSLPLHRKTIIYLVPIWQFLSQPSTGKVTVTVCNEFSTLQLGRRLEPLTDEPGLIDIFFMRRLYSSVPNVSSAV